MRKAIIIAATCLLMTGCGPAEPEKKAIDGKEFMKGFGECPTCGTRSINIFGGADKAKESK